MGQAKRRGTKEQRVEAALATHQARRPSFLTCGNCKAEVKDFERMDTRQFEGIRDAYGAICPSCGHQVWGFYGDRDAVAAAAQLMQQATEEDLGLPEGSLATHLRLGR